MGKAFFAQARKTIAAARIGSLTLVAVDIKHFWLFNKLRGRAMGDELLTALKGELSPLSEVTGYMGADDFALLLPRGEERLRAVREAVQRVLGRYGAPLGLVPVFGVYELGEEEGDPALMYDRARLALSQVCPGGRGGVSTYEPGMEARLGEELALPGDAQGETVARAMALAFDGFDEGVVVCRVARDEEGALSLENIYYNGRLGVEPGDEAALRSLLASGLGTTEERQRLGELMYEAAEHGHSGRLGVYSSALARFLELRVFRVSPGYCALIFIDSTDAHTAEAVLKSISHAYREIGYLDLARDTYRVLLPPPLGPTAGSTAATARPSRIASAPASSPPRTRPGRAASCSPKTSPPPSASPTRSRKSTGGAITPARNTASPAWP